MNSELVHQHFILNKPYGCLSAFVNNPTRKKQLLGDLFNFRTGTMAIGRLDVDSEGLLLLTTDGKMSEKIRSSTVEKEYYVQLDGIIREEAIVKLTKGLEICFGGKKYITKSCKATILPNNPELPERSKQVRDQHRPTSWMSITLTEGKYRQVRKMTAAVGFPTLRLVRIRIGNIHLNHMKPGDVIEVSELDV